MDDKALHEQAERWLAADPDPDTRAELSSLLKRQDLPGLRERFARRLAFGTAGLRGLLGAGPGYMNQLVVAQTTAGLCDHIRASQGESGASKGLCIGYDGRRKSRLFADEAARVATARGFRVHRFSHVVPTPLLAFAVRDLGAAAGVMVTASHNPADYNGFKVYWDNGAQIIAPQDAQIAAAIDRVAEDWSGSGSTNDLGGSVEGQVQARYLAFADKYPQSHPQPVIAYTAMHGVGEALLRAMFERAGITSLHSVEEQAEPDMDFPTVEFPNPEEAGAMDLVLALALRVQADLVLANDPDADRLCVAAINQRGEHQALTGNDLGVLLADHLLRGCEDPARALVLNSIVSTPLVGRIAEAYGAHHEVTLTGFKWICNRALELEEAGDLRFLFGFEEALGYSVGSHVRDKDGITAALVVADLAAQLKREGHTLWDRLHGLWRRHGMFLSGQLTLKLPGAEGLAQMQTCMERARQTAPAQVAGLAVTHIRDLLVDPSLPATNALIWQLEGGHRLALRPSGTEPKLKVYLDVCQAMSADMTVPQAQQAAEATLSALKQAMQQFLK